MRSCDTDPQHPSHQDIPLETLAVLKPLQSLLPEYLSAVRDDMRQHWLFSGDVLFDVGQFDSDIYYLLYGAVTCTFPDGEEITLDAYDQFTAIADVQPRNCRVTATTDCSVISLNKTRLDELLTWSQTAEYLLADIAANPDLDEDAHWMSTVLHSNLFLKVPPTNMSEIFHSIHSETVYNGDVIIRQGEIGEHCYFIKEGKAEVTRRVTEKQPVTHLANIGPGRCFGEDALVRETVRNANVTMQSDGVLMILNKDQFLELMKEPSPPSTTWSKHDDGWDKAIIIDVRTEEEFCNGHVHNALNIPLRLLALKRRILSFEQPCVLYCDSGRRSKVAAWLLNQAGFNALFVESGLTSLPEGSGLIKSLPTIQTS